MPIPRATRRLIRQAGFALCLLAVAGAGCSRTDAEDRRQAGSPTPPAAGAGSKAAVVDQALHDRLNEIIEFTGRRRLNPRVHNAWQIVHGVLAYGPALELDDQGKVVRALDYLQAGGQVRGWNLVPGEKGLETILEEGSKSGQGHEDQWLGYLSQCGLAWDDPILVQGQQFKVGDMVTQAQWDVREGMEATWTLMALGTYLPLDAQWTAKDGSPWTLERIVRMEAAQDLAESPCGGTHRLYALAMALNRYLADGGKLEGGWKAADEKLQQAIATARSYQQPDGSFSTHYFRRAGGSADIGLRISTTGHTLELIAAAVTDEQLREPWVSEAVVALCDMLEATRELPVECGGLYHAAHGLMIYRHRVFGDPLIPAVAIRIPSAHLPR